MLQKIRDRATGPLAWIIVGIISVPFAFFGIDALRTTGGQDNAAIVGDEEISNYQLSNQYDARYQQLQDMLGENFRADLIDPKLLRQNVLDGLISASVLRQYLDDQGYRVSDTEVLEFIRNQAAFQVDGRFSAETYRELLARQGQGPVGYEARVREFLTSEQLRAAVTDSYILAPGEVAERYRIENQRRVFAYRRYDAETLAEQASIDDAQIRERYEQGKAAYRSPERVRVQYLELDRDAIAADIQVSEADLRAFYESEKDSRFTVPEERKARHILIRVGDERSDADAEAKIRELASELTAGGDFATVAERESDDPGSKGQGGDLGWVRRGAMVPEFEAALFATPVDAVSEPVQTSFGWHLIRVDEIRPAQVQAFEDEAVQERLTMLFRDRESREILREKAEQLEQLSFETPDSLDPAAQALGLPLKESEWFTRGGGAGIASDEAVTEAAFSQLVLDDRENSRPLAVDGKQIVLRVLEHEAEEQMSLDAVREEILAELRSEAGQRAAREAAEADLGLLRGGRDWDSLPADSEAVEVIEETEVTREDSAVNRRLLGEVFNLARPQDGQPEFGTASLAGGDQALILLSEVADGDWGQASEEEREALRDRMLAAAAGREFAALQAGLREGIEIEILNGEL